jgi:zinc transport system permease protein
MAELFALPFFAGLAVALLLPLLGNLLRLRDEWLATLGLAHLSAATALVGMAAGLPPIWGAPLGALAGAGLRHAAGGRGHSAYGLMILGGWSAGLLVAANTALGGALAHALADGQLYFAGWREFWFDAILLACALPALRWLTPRLVAARLLPEGELANRLPAWHWHLGFDLLTALTIAAATATVGLMAAFALVFVPPWLAFRHAPDWRAANRLATAIGAGAYALAFALALWLDQPYGPVLAAVLVIACGGLRTHRRPAGADFSA